MTDIPDHLPVMTDIPDHLPVMTAIPDHLPVIELSLRGLLSVMTAIPDSSSMSRSTEPPSNFSSSTLMACSLPAVMAELLQDLTTTSSGNNFLAEMEITETSTRIR